MCLSCSSVIERCAQCSPSSVCTGCAEGYTLSGNTCSAASCGSALAETSGVGVATDETSFAAAVASGKSVILIDKSFTLSKIYTLEPQKLVGAGYYSDKPECASQTKPTLTVASGYSLTINKGGIYNLNISFLNSGTSIDTLVMPGGIIKNSTITVNKANRGIVFSGTETANITDRLIPISNIRERIQLLSAE